jgi:hypothetical protein
MTLERTQSIRSGNNILLMTDLYPSFAAAAAAPDSWKTRRTADSFEPAS